MRVGAPNVARLRPKPLSRVPVGPAVALILSVFALSGFAGCGGPSEDAANSAPRIEYGSFHSDAVAGTLHYSIALPPGYDSTRMRYPVVYFLHGLPANDQAYRNIGGYADSLARSGHSAIIVGAQGARAGDTDPEWHNWGEGRNWETATEKPARLVRRPPLSRAPGALGPRDHRRLGRRLRSDADRDPPSRDVSGDRVVELANSVLTDPDGKPLDLGSAEANADANAHASVSKLREKFGPYPTTFFGFYIGRQDPYPGFVEDDMRLSEELTAAGGNTRMSSELYEGAHDEAFWDAHQDEWLGVAVDRLDPPS